MAKPFVVVSVRLIQPVYVNGTPEMSLYSSEGKFDMSMKVYHIRLHADPRFISVESVDKTSLPLTLIPMSNVSYLTIKEIDEDATEPKRGRKTEG